MSKTFTVEEIAKHNTAQDCWIIIEGKVYDMSKFLAGKSFYFKLLIFHLEHPGGSKVVLKVAGKDATKEFKSLHNNEVLKKYAPDLYIGDVGVAATAEPQVKYNSKIRNLIHYLGGC
jgi:cytochrome b involved in lipid metabolism